MKTSNTGQSVTRRNALRCTVVVAAVLFGVALLAAPGVGAATGKPGFYTDEFHFQFDRPDLTAICGFPVWQTLDGEVHGWDRVDASGAVDGNVQVTITGAFYSDQATVPFKAKTRNMGTDNPDGSGIGTNAGIMALVTVPGQSAVEVVAGRLVATFPAGGGEPTFAVTGQNTEDEFFGTIGNPGTLCTLLAG